MRNVRPLSSERRCSAMKNCGGWNRTNDLLGQSQALRTSSNRPAVFLHSRFVNRRKVRGEGFEPPSPVSKAGSLPLADPRECPAGVEPACPAWKAGAFAARPRARSSSKRFIFRKIEMAAEGEGVEPSRLIARRFSKPLPSPVGLPFRKAAVTGIEPVSARLTAACSYQHELHRNAVGVVRFELTISCFQSRRISRLSYTPQQAPSGSRTRTSDMASR